MRSQELYYFSDPEIHASLVHAKKVCACLRSMTIYDEDYRQVIEELIPGIPQSTTICPPFHCDHGTGIILGENVFMNYDCIMLDGGYIRIGKHTLIGPHCQFYTPQHPMDYVERREEKETAYPITIGEDCWLVGTGCVCCRSHWNVGWCCVPESRWGIRSICLRTLQTAIPPCPLLCGES